MMIISAPIPAPAKNLQDDQPRGGWSEGARERKDRIKKQQGHEDDAAAKAITAHAEGDRADKHAEEA